MERIAASDLANAKQGLEIARRDPRLDLAVRLDLDDPSLVSILEAKIRYAETIVPRQFTAARAEARRFP
jgi:Flp pilus assembly protein TadD